MKSTNNPRCRFDDIVVQDLESEVLIYDLKSNKAFCLNETSALVWRFCDGTKSVAEINESVSKKLKLDVSEEIIWLALDQLKQDNLLVGDDGVQVKFNGLSRREVIRKVGAASMIALPFIASLVAPRSVDAQSTCAAVSCTCSRPNNLSGVAQLCRGTLGGTSGCPNRPTCDCFVSGGMGNTGGTCTGS